jgi:hypothetical protein
MSKQFGDNALTESFLFLGQGLMSTQAIVVISDGK